MLEIHPSTATEAGSLAGLARHYREIGRKQREGETLTPAERNFVGYDATQLMPIEPIIQRLVCVAANMEGQPADVSPAILADGDDIPTDGWQVELAAPGLDCETGADASTVALADSQAICWRREP